MRDKYSSLNLSCDFNKEPSKPQSLNFQVNFKEY